MGNIAVIYKSKYGTTGQYAQCIARALGATLLEASAVKPSQLVAFDGVIYGGGLYAGGIAGVELVTKNPCNLLAVFTVGLADPQLTAYSEILSKNFTPQQLTAVKVFHLRGGINYKKLGPIHKLMMAMMRRVILKRGKAELSEEDREFLKTYGSAVNFTDESTVEPLLAYVRGL